MRWPTIRTALGRFPFAFGAGLVGLSTAFPDFRDWLQRWVLKGWAIVTADTRSAILFAFVFLVLVGTYVVCWAYAGAPRKRKPMAISDDAIRQARERPPVD